MNSKPRAILPDAMNQTDIILIECCSDLRPTYEVRLATQVAQQTHRKLRLILSAGGSAHPSLTVFARQHGIAIEHRP